MKRTITTLIIASVSTCALADSDWRLSGKDQSGDSIILFDKNSIQSSKINGTEVWYRVVYQSPQSKYGIDFQQVYAHGRNDCKSNEIIVDAVIFRDANGNTVAVDNSKASARFDSDRTPIGQIVAFACNRIPLSGSEMTLSDQSTVESVVKYFMKSETKN